MRPKTQITTSRVIVPFGFFGLSNQLILYDPQSKLEVDGFHPGVQAPHSGAQDPAMIFINGGDLIVEGAFQI